MLHIRRVLHLAFDFFCITYTSSVTGTYRGNPYLCRSRGNCLASFYLLTVSRQIADLCRQLWLWLIILIWNKLCHKIFWWWYLRNRKHVPCFYRVIQTRVEVWENEKCCGYTSRRRVFPQLFRVLPNFYECLYNSIETRSTCFLFLLENNATRKRKTTC